MSKEYNIFSKEDFNLMVGQFNNYFKKRELSGLPFQKLKIISKRWQKPKTSKQHRAYWAAIGQLKKALVNVGYDVNEEDCHQFIKYRSGFTKEIDGVVITKSISDVSEDATIENLNYLIDFIIRFASESLSYNIEINTTE